MSDDLKLVFHITPSANEKSIGQYGIDPSFSRTPTNLRSWFVEAKRVEWAIIHVSYKYDLPTSKIAVYAVVAPINAIVRYPLDGVYYSKKIIQPHPNWHYAYLVSELWRSGLVETIQEWANVIPF